MAIDRFHRLVTVAAPTRLRLATDFHIADRTKTPFDYGDDFRDIFTASAP